MNAAAMTGVMENVEARTVVLASADAALRARLCRSLTGLRWRVREAGGGAEAMAFLEASTPEALLIDSWLPDLEVGEFAGHIRLMYPAVDLLRLDGGGAERGEARSPRRHELLHALREAQNAPATDTAAWKTAAITVPGVRVPTRTGAITNLPRWRFPEAAQGTSTMTPPETEGDAPLGEMVGTSSVMRELARMVRLVAPRSATVLIEGETGTGKEVVAKAIHRLSTRAAKPFVVLNCAAIPEALLEAELFGHTRGAFTGAVQSRTGRIEAAHGGTLLLDEIGEMPMALQSKMLRFLECGELQRVGDNEPVRVNVRVIAATHQPLEQRAEEGTFRLDLYHRLAVFPIAVPALRERVGDIGLLAEFFLERLGLESPRKRLTEPALHLLQEHSWPGNVRELMHVLERGAILCGESPVIDAEEIRIRRSVR